MDMCVGPTCKVKDPNPAPKNDGAAPPKSAKEFNDALNQSGNAKDASHAQDSKDNQSSQHAQDASNAKHDLTELGRERAQKLSAMPKVYAAPQAVQLANPPSPVVPAGLSITNIEAVIRTGPP